MTVRPQRSGDRQHPSIGTALFRTLGTFWAYAIGAATVAVAVGEMVAMSLQHLLPREPVALTSTVALGLAAASAYDRVVSAFRTRGR